MTETPRQHWLRQAEEHLDDASRLCQEQDRLPADLCAHIARARDALSRALREGEVTQAREEHLREAETPGADSVREAQRMETLGRMAGGVAHEFNNLLMIINGQVQFALDALPPDDAVRADIEAIREAGQRAAELTGQLLALSRRQPAGAEPVDLSYVVSGVARVLRRVIGENVTLHLDLSPSVGVVRADPAQIEQVLLNLALNARDAMPSGGTLGLETRSVELDEEEAASLGLRPGRYGVLTVSDTGHGMSLEVQAHLFEPYFTTKPRGRGSGLGLSVVQGLVSEMGGAVSATSEEQVGSAFSVYLPTVTASRAAATSTGAQDPLPHGSETVLLVEDDDMVRRMTLRMLKRLGYSVLEADSAERAYELFFSAERRPDIVLTDVIMPGESGSELVERLRTRVRNLRVLYMSGYPREQLGAHGVLRPGIHILQKPFNISGLASRLREVLDEPRALEAGGKHAY